MKDLEDQIIDVILVLDSTSDFILSLHEMYRQFCRDHDKNRGDPDNGGFDTIDVALQERNKVVISSRRKMDTLHSKVKGTMKLVSKLRCILSA